MVSRFQNKTRQNAWLSVPEGPHCKANSRLLWPTQRLEQRRLGQDTAEVPTRPTVSPVLSIGLLPPVPSRAGPHTCPDLASAGDLPCQAHPTRTGSFSLLTRTAWSMEWVLSLQFPNYTNFITAVPIRVCVANGK